LTLALFSCLIPLISLSTFKRGFGILAGIVMGMTVPVLYMKYEDNIKRHGERVKGQARRFYDTVDEKVVKNMKNKVVVERKEEKKVE
jgi:hypothetical protein